MPPKGPKLWPEGGAIDKQDQALTRPLFALSLGKLEYPLSVWCMVGMPPFLAVGPTLIALLKVGSGIERPYLVVPLLLLIMGKMGHVWTKFVFGDVKLASKYFFAFLPVVACPPVGLLLARLGGEEGFAAGAFHTTAWFASMIPLMLLKHRCARRRPIIVQGTPSPPRKITSISRVLAQDAHVSFPSGDAASAVAFAVPIGVACGWPVLAALCVALSAFARIYWRAHFLLDVTAGAALGLVVTVSLHATICPIGAVRWWLPLIFQGLFIGFALMLRKKK